MRFCVVQRKSKGGQQFNGVEYPFELITHGWESTRLLYLAGKIPKNIKEEFVYITEYDPEDWE